MYFSSTDEVEMAYANHDLGVHAKVHVRMAEYDANGKEWQFPGTYIDTANTHGTGCTLSSAIATRLAFGDSLPDAVKNATISLQNALLHGQDVKTGNGHGPLNHFFNPQKLQIQTK